jgi:peptidoglycan L-alanyl-D-glutamate endopeptidase CwlK
MTYSLGKKSLDRLSGVHPDLVAVVKRAIKITEQDFGVHEGVRSRARQEQLFKAGATKTLDGRHITGHAVDLVPYIGGRLRWEWKPLFAVAVAVDQAATELGVPIRWGGVWDRLMADYGGSPAAMQREVDAYCSRHPGPDFIDGPHFELPRKEYPA